MLFTIGYFAFELFNEIPFIFSSQSSPVRSPSRLSPFDLRKFSAEDEYQASPNATVPSTPGPWFDRDGRQISPSSTFIRRDVTEIIREDAMVTPPPSEESDDEPLSPVIAQSILLKVRFETHDSQCRHSR